MWLLFGWLLVLFFCFLVRIYSTVNAFILVERAWSSITEWLVTSITIMPLSHSWAPSVWCIGSIVFKFTSRYDYQRLVSPSNQIAHSGAMKDTQLPCQLRLGFSISCNQHVCAVFSNRVLSFSSDGQPREITRQSRAFLDNNSKRVIPHLTLGFLFNNL